MDKKINTSVLNKELILAAFDNDLNLVKHLISRGANNLTGALISAQRGYLWSHKIIQNEGTDKSTIEFLKQELSI